MRLDEVDIFSDLGVKAWQSSGTPVDCVKLAHDVILHRKPDICLSGINHGSNASINVIYSGTMSAAMEAAIDGVQSIGFSLEDYTHEANFEFSRPYVHQIVTKLLEKPLPFGTLLNVNIPKTEKIKGIKVCRQCVGKYAEHFEERTDPNGKKYYWMTGKFINLEPDDNDTDIWALENNYISAVPTKFDLTSHSVIQHLRQIL